MTHRRLRRGLVLAGAAVLAVALSGCTPFGIACPAIGYVSTVEVVLVGDIVRVDTVRFCDDEGWCSLSADERLPDPAPTQATLLPRATSDPVEQAVYTAQRVDAGHWTITVLTGLPTRGTATAYSAEGTVVGEATATLDWERVGGTEQCGGPMEAGPIELTVG